VSGEAVTRVFVGTMKGLFQFTSADRKSWQRAAFHFPDVPVYATAFDGATQTLYAAVNDVFYGPTVQRSTDMGRTWQAGHSAPSYAGDDPEKVTRVWSLLPAPSEGQGVVYAGVEASGLFRSEDGGDTWTEVASLRAHPTHETWNPGNGGKCLHTITLDPAHAGRMYVAASAGGAYRTDDGGNTWQPINTGVRVDFMPGGIQYPESGQCVHKVAMSPTRAERMWMQNHGGVYRSDDGGDTWVDIGQSLPSDFGFPVVAHPHDPDKAYIVPLGGEPDNGRWCVDNQLGLYATDDAGASWHALNAGLPGDVYTSVLRDGMAHDDHERVGLYFGTTTGSLCVSNDEGVTWQEPARHLSRILSVEVVGPQP
jgi:photosystem II stability/assembly factor-like uncharacterized protein